MEMEGARRRLCRGIGRGLFLLMGLLLLPLLLLMEELRGGCWRI